MSMTGALVRFAAEMSEDWLAIVIGLGLAAMVGAGLITHVPW